jgi:hypothetical protein
MKFCNTCSKHISNSNWSYHIKTNKHKRWATIETTNDNSTIINISEKTQKQLKSIINKEKNIDQYYCESYKIWISKSHKSHHQKTNKHNKFCEINPSKTALFLNQVRDEVQARKNHRKPTIFKLRSTSPKNPKTSTFFYTSSIQKTINLRLFNT